MAVSLGSDPVCEAVHQADLLLHSEAECLFTIFLLRSISKKISKVCQCKCMKEKFASDAIDCGALFLYSPASLLWAMNITADW